MILFFFSRKVYQIFDFFLRFDLIFFQVQFISFVKNKKNATIEQQTCIGHENVI